jgi:hypothetical protein
MYVIEKMRHQINRKLFDFHNCWFENYSDIIQTQAKFAKNISTS